MKNIYFENKKTKEQFHVKVISDDVDDMDKILDQFIMMDISFINEDQFDENNDLITIEITRSDNDDSVIAELRTLNIYT